MKNKDRESNLLLDNLIWEREQVMKLTAKYRRDKVIVGLTGIVKHLISIIENESVRP